jgi:hypothetical protein
LVFVAILEDRVKPYENVFHTISFVFPSLLSILFDLVDTEHPSKRSRSRRGSMNFGSNACLNGGLHLDTGVRSEVLRMSVLAIATGGRCGPSTYLMVQRISTLRLFE